MGLHIGTSGWAYPEWRPAFYPQGLPQSRFLAHYAGEMNACEVNTTFYGLQEESAVAEWAAATGDDFRFTAKAHRRLTHVARMTPGAPWLGFLRQFLASLAPLEDRLGALLFQYAPTRARDDDGLAAVLEALAGLPFAIELRDPSWAAQEIEEAIAGGGGTVCVSETEGMVPDRLPPGPIAYVRMRADRYSEAARDAWLELLLREAATRPVFAFAKHKDIPAGDPLGGVGMAQWLVDRAGLRPAGPAPVSSPGGRRRSS